MFHRARHHKGHVMIPPHRIEWQLMMQASLSLQPCQGHTASHDLAMASNHSAWYLHSERHVGHTHRPPPPTHSLTPWSKDATYTPKGVQKSSSRKTTMSKDCRHPATQADRFGPFGGVW